MSNTLKAVTWTSKVKPKHLTIGTVVQLRNGVFTTIVRMDGVSPITRVKPQGGVKFHRPDGTHHFGEPQYDIVKVLKAAKDKPLDLRKAVVGSRVVFSTGETAVVTEVDLDGSETTHLSLSNTRLCDGWYVNHSGEYFGETSRPRIIKVKPPKKGSE